jgi:hypothetical protein
MGTDIDNVLANLEEAIEHIEYFAKTKSYSLDQSRLDLIVAELVTLVKQIDGSN